MLIMKEMQKMICGHMEIIHNRLSNVLVNILDSTFIMLTTSKIDEIVV